MADSIKVPDGWKLVPMEPTDEMALAAIKVSLRNPAINGVNQYRAMLAAAPAAPTQAHPLPTGKLDSVWKEHSETLGGWGYYGVDVMEKLDFQDAAREIERACAEAWGVKLSEGD